MELKSILPALRCPDCRQGRLDIAAGARLVCGNCQSSFGASGSRPVLLRHDNALFPASAYNADTAVNAVGSSRGWAALVPSPSVNLARARILPQLRQRLTVQPTAVVLVVGGGMQRQWLERTINSALNLQVLYTDIDSAADVDIFCDAHELPFDDGAVDAVVTTAVLEHVMYPERVAAEIHRVLKIGGLLYSELPFMQQVHEGAYDFTRYTLSGHRRLFNGFTEIEAGMVAGPATAFVWSLENLVLAFIRGALMRKLVKAAVRVTFGWIKYLDYWLKSRPEAMDGASCTYFFGAKATQKVDDTEIVHRYVGAKHLRHI